MTFDDYDFLIQLCDCLASPEGVIDMGKRMDEVAIRYGCYPISKRNKNLELKDYFERKAGINIYRIVTDNEGLWGL